MVLRVIVPPFLDPGDPVAVCAPGGPVDPARLRKGIAWLEDHGHRVVKSPRLMGRRGYLAGPDEARAADLNMLLSKSAPSTIIFARGGYGMTRILDRIDLKALRRHPKLLVGYSDVTALFMALQSEGPYPVLYGPMVSELGEPSAFDEASFLAALRGDRAASEVTLRPRDALRHGAGKGILIGGCLSLLVSLLGTPFDASYDGAILFWEEIGEPPYRIDKMLTQLRNAGKLARLRGMVIGSLAGCEPAEGRPSLRLREAILGAIGAEARYPIVWNVRAGHILGKITLPLGVLARLDTEAGILRLGRSA